MPEALRQIARQVFLAPDGLTETHGDSEDASGLPLPPLRPLVRAISRNSVVITEQKQCPHGSLPDSSSSSAGTLQFPIVELSGNGMMDPSVSGECTFGSAGKGACGARPISDRERGLTSGETRR